MLALLVFYSNPVNYKIYVFQLLGYHISQVGFFKTKSGTLVRPNLIRTSCHETTAGFSFLTLIWRHSPSMSVWHTLVHVHSPTVNKQLDRSRPTGWCKKIWLYVCWQLLSATGGTYKNDFGTSDHSHIFYPSLSQQLSLRGRQTRNAIINFKAVLFL